MSVVKRSTANLDPDRTAARPDLPARPANWRVLFIALLAAILGAQGVYASSKRNVSDGDLASPSEVAEKQSDLKSLRDQIDALSREMTAAEASRREARDQLQEAERAISSTQRELHDLTTRIGRLQMELKNLDMQSKALEHGLNTQQTQLEKNHV